MHTYLLSEFLEEKKSYVYTAYVYLLFKFLYICMVPICIKNLHFLKTCKGTDFL